MRSNQWTYFQVDGEGDATIGIKTLKKKYADVWWNFYPGHFRLGIFSGVEPDRVLADVTEAYFGCVVQEINNPDFKIPDITVEVVEQINQIKLKACRLVSRFNYKTPETDLSPSYWCYFIHIFFNSLGATYQQEAEILAHNVNEALRNQRNVINGYAEERPQDSVHE